MESSDRPIGRIEASLLGRPPSPARTAVRHPGAKAIRRLLEILTADDRSEVRLVINRPDR